MNECGVDADIVTHEKYLDEYSEIPKEKLVVFANALNVSMEGMKNLICDLKVRSYDMAIIPSRSYSPQGMENVIEVVKNITSKALMIYDNAQTEVI